MSKITLKAARVNAGLTQKEAAKKLGISNQTLSRYEKDASDLKMSMIWKLCDLYGITSDALFLGK